MDKDLRLRGNNYNIAVMVFTLAYVVFGVPANIIFKKTGPKSLSVMMFFWGICAMGQGLVRNFAGLVALRFLMGVFEVSRGPSLSLRPMPITNYRIGWFRPWLRLPDR